MKPPTWKRMLSYVLELHVESTSSEYNPHLYVSLKNGRYQLSTANAVYSYGDLYDNFSGAFKQIDLDKADIKTVLVLGLGLGSIPIILEKVFDKQYHYTAVEIDEEVVFLASKYTLPELQSNIEVICADASNYILQCEQQFDLIAVDLFIDDVIPESFQQDTFLLQIQNLLTDKGILLYNHLAYSKKDVVRARSFYEEKFKPIFQQGTFVETNGNWMMMNTEVYLK